MRKPDPDGKNFKRACWAAVALVAFQKETGTDNEDAVKDLLADLMHYCDEYNQDFAVALDAARHHYATETGAREPFQVTPEIAEAGKKLIDWKDRAIEPYRTALTNLLRRVQQLENPLNVISGEQLEAQRVLGKEKS